MLSLAFRRLIFVSTIYFTATIAQSIFDWETLKPSTTLDWKPCYGSPFQCTRLKVPFDYSAPEIGYASIAIVRLPSTAPKSKYRGPILYNPGGPGGSGVDSVVSPAGAYFASIFGDQYDIVGFDPRGVSYSTPTISFFKTEAERRFLIPSPTNVIYPSLNASSNALSQVWAENQLLGQLALAIDTSHLFQHMSTDNIARDMLAITKAFGQEKLQYYGISYGSVLGATFATLFPDKVERMILDGVFVMESYFTLNMTSMMVDADPSLQSFFDGCYQAGPEGCPFYEPSASAISAKLDNLTATVKEKPFVVLTPGSYGLIDYDFFRNVILDSLFDPYDSESGFEPLAQALASLAEGNATALYNMGAVPTFECQAPTEAFHLNNLEAYMAIACGDALPINDTLAELQEYWANGLSTSSFSDVLSAPRVFCAGYKTHRAGRFVGPMGANTSVPLLLVGNSLDAGTAHVGAVQTSKLFPRSAVLTQDCVGHTSLVAPSACTAAYFGAYFANGTLPAPGTICPIDIEMFPSSANASTKRTLQTSEEKRLLDAWGKISRATPRRAL
ncbi:Alpha/Beta hydrolase protein [Mycena galopus ATCC 62051]|nr:Alpha/Beta hydrolase protein [Mycena galopus ATCC 62051]